MNADSIFLRNKKIGFIGAGNMSQSIISSLLASGTLKKEQVFVTNRSPGKLEKLKKQYDINVLNENEELIEAVDIVILAMKPQDLVEAMEPISSSFDSSQIIISLAAGISLKTLQSLFPQVPAVFRVMANTAIKIQESAMGYCFTPAAENHLQTIEELFGSLGQSFTLLEGESFEAFMVATSSSIGFIYEMMSYWQGWLEERDIDPNEAKEMVTQTFIGASLLASKSPGKTFEELRDKVVSKKGVTAAGLQSMRELDLERIIRISFGKALDRDQELRDMEN